MLLKVCKHLCGSVRASLYALCLVPIVLTSGCSDSATAIPANEAVVKALEAEPLVPAPAQSPAHPVLYLDTSESMRGFASERAKDGLYLRAVRVLYRQAAQAYRDVEMWGVSARERKIQQFSEIESPATYSGGDTPLAAIITKLATRVREGKTAVLVSDMVQSEGVRDVRDLSNAMMDLSGNGTKLALLGFRSAFDGTYFVETAPRERFQAYLDGTTSGRPFYVLVAAPTDAAMEDLKRTILRSLIPSSAASVESPKKDESHPTVAPGTNASSAAVPESQEGRDTRAEFLFSPTDSPIVVESKWSFPKEDVVLHWDLYRRALPPTVPFDQFTLTDCGDATCALALEVAAKERLQVRSEKDFAAQVSRVTFMAGKAKDKMVSAEWLPSVHRIHKRIGPAQQPVLTSYLVTYPLPKPGNTEWTAFRVKLSPGRGNLELPEWVSHWSTQDDHGQANLSRTLNLDAVVGTMIHEISEKAVFFDHMVLVGKR